MNKQQIIVSGNILAGFRMTGPFTDRNQARFYLDAHFLKLTPALITSLSSPEGQLQPPSLQAVPAPVPAGKFDEHVKSLVREHTESITKHTQSIMKDVTPAPGLAKLLRNILDAAEQINNLGKDSPARGERVDDADRRKQRNDTLRDAEDEAEDFDPV